MLQGIRAFFASRGVLEVDTPALSAAAATDPALQSLRVALDGHDFWLHTSPEFPMKRLLAAGSGDIFQVCKVFRAGERGRWHNPEFTLLEWYRVGHDHFRLMDEVVELIESVRPPESRPLTVRRVRYADLFREQLGIDTLGAPDDELAARARVLGVAPEGALSRDGWLDLLLSTAVQPHFPDDQLTLLYDYPASQAALARLNADGATAARFEVFWGPLELANGFHELGDAAEQRRRFEADLGRRRAEGSEPVPMDERLLAALEHGLPECAGVALGIDRLLMRVTGAQRIDEVLSFSIDRA